jgi:N-acetylated-alpha-linked acidic dipeptidase
MATAMLRMADAPVLPFDFVAATRTYHAYADEIAKLAAGNDTTKGLDLSAVRTALQHVDSAAAVWQRSSAAVDGAAGLDARAAALAPVNHQLALTEQALADSAGLPRRPWFRHLVYAPGAYTGYGVKTMPGIREAVEARRTAEAQTEATRVAQAIDRYAVAIRAAAEALDHVLQ